MGGLPTAETLLITCEEAPGLTWYRGLGQDVEWVCREDGGGSADGPSKCGETQGKQGEIKGGQLGGNMAAKLPAHDPGLTLSLWNPSSHSDPL